MELLRSIRRGNLLFQNILISFITINLTEFKNKEHTIYCLVQVGPGDNPKLNIIIYNVLYGV